MAVPLRLSLFNDGPTTVAFNAHCEIGLSNWLTVPADKKPGRLRD